MKNQFVHSLSLTLRSMFALIVAIALAGCSRPAPVSVNFRQSIMHSAGQVMIVQNIGAGHLSCKMNVWNETHNQSRAHSFGLAPGEKTEIGLLEADWSFQTGEKYEIQVEGYSSYDGRVP